MDMSAQYSDDDDDEVAVVRRDVAREMPVERRRFDIIIFPMVVLACVSFSQIMIEDRGSRSSIILAVLSVEAAT